MSARSAKPPCRRDQPQPAERSSGTGPCRGGAFPGDRHANPRCNLLACQDVVALALLLGRHHRSQHPPSLKLLEPVQRRTPPRTTAACLQNSQCDRASSARVETSSLAMPLFGPSCVAVGSIVGQSNCRRSAARSHRPADAKGTDVPALGTDGAASLTGLPRSWLGWTKSLSASVSASDPAATADVCFLVRSRLASASG